MDVCINPLSCQRIVKDDTICARGSAELMTNFPHHALNEDWRSHTLTNVLYTV